MTSFRRSELPHSAYLWTLILFMALLASQGALRLTQAQPAGTGPWKQGFESFERFAAAWGRAAGGEAGTVMGDAFQRLQAAVGEQAGAESALAKFFVAFHALAAGEGGVAQGEGQMNQNDEPERRLGELLAGMAQGALADVASVTPQGALRLELFKLLGMEPMELKAKLLGHDGASDEQAGSKRSAEEGAGGAAGLDTELKAMLQRMSKLFKVDYNTIQQQLKEVQQRKVQDKINYGTNPVLQLAERLEQLSRIVRSEQVSGRYCSPFTYIPEGTPDGETFVGPQLLLTASTGNCVLINEIEGAGFPSWTNLFRRVACLGPALEYLLLPPIYLGPARLPEVFVCAECIFRRSWGPSLELVLYGGKEAVTYASKADFHAALATNKTFDFGFMNLGSAIERLQAQLAKHSWLFSDDLLRFSFETGEEQAEFESMQQELEAALARAFAATSSGAAAGGAQQAATDGGGSGGGGAAERGQQQQRKQQQQAEEEPMIEVEQLLSHAEGAGAGTPSHRPTVEMHRRWFASAVSSEAAGGKGGIGAQAAASRNEALMLELQHRLREGRFIPRAPI